MELLKEQTILIVEDESTLRDILASGLKKLGAQVLTTDNGVSAFDLIRVTRFDLIITDVQMPLGDGFGLMRKIVALDGHRPKVIVMSGEFNHETANSHIEGAAALLPKPFSFENFVELIIRTLDLSLST